MARARTTSRTSASRTEAPADGVHRCLRVGQELAGVRHRRRGVATADQRDLQRLRAGLHADAGAPEVDVLQGLTTAIIVDQQRMGANPRSTVGTATDANAMLRILFSPPRAAAHRLAPGVLLQRRLNQRSRCGHARARRGDREGARSFSITGGMCPRARGMGSVTDFNLSALYDDRLSLNEGALTIPGYTMDGWYGRIFRGCASSTRTSRSASTPRRRRTTCSTKSRPRSRSTGST